MALIEQALLLMLGRWCGGRGGITTRLTGGKLSQRVPAGSLPDGHSVWSVCVCVCVCVS